VELRESGVVRIRWAIEGGIEAEEQQLSVSSNYCWS
jgi:hypothetical protein